MNIQTNPDDAETDRIRLWRAERAAVAEVEKQDRIRKAAEERERQLASDDATRRADAAALLPDEADISRATAALHRRLRSNTRRLALHLAVFVLLPTLCVLAYLSQIATPLYEARSVILIAKPGDTAGAQLGGILGSLSGQSSLSEAFMAQEFIRSQAMMDQLEGASGLVSALSSDQMDPVRRLRDLPVLRLDKHDQFARFVDAAINIQTGMITLYVRTPDPDQSIAISQTVLDAAAAQITGLSETLFQQRLDRARAAVAEARADLTTAQSDLIRFQITTGEANPQARIESIYATLRQLEVDRQDLTNQIAEKAAIGGGKAFQTDRMTELAKGLDARIAEQRRLLVAPGPDGAKSLNAMLLDYQLLLMQVSSTTEALTLARQTLASATDAAALGRSTFQIVVPPRTGENPSAPNVPMTSLVVLLSLLGLFSVVKLLIPQRSYV